MSSFADRLAVALDRKNWSQADLARAVGLSRGMISAIKNGATPGRKSMKKLAEALDVPREWLSVGENPPEWVIDERPGAIYTEKTSLPEPDLERVVVEQAAEITRLRREIARLHAIINRDRAVPRESSPTPPSRKPSDTFDDAESEAARARNLAEIDALSPGRQQKRRRKRRA